MKTIFSTNLQILSEINDALKEKFDEKLIIEKKEILLELKNLIQEEINNV